MPYKSIFKYFDWWLLSLVLLLCFIGLIILYSALAGVDILQSKSLLRKQVLWYLTGILAMLLSIMIDYRFFKRFSYLIYIISICFLNLVLFFGKNAGGAQRWLDVGFFCVQPSEMAKIAIVIIISSIYSESIRRRGLRIIDLLRPFIITLIPFLLIVRQPDLGTAMVILFVVASITLFLKVENKAFLFVILCILILMPIFWVFLKNYQKNRILVFLNPYNDPLGTGYHIIQSKIAIGSGMLTGKGFMRGTQNLLSFLPEQHTDFIFSVLAEEWGFLGSIIVLLIFLSILFRGILIASRCRNSFGTILAIGIVSIFAWQIFINIGMVMGLLPVVGVTLPFISYGGSSILTMMICVGILLNISVRRY